MKYIVMPILKTIQTIIWSLKIITFTGIIAIVNFFLILWNANLTFEWFLPDPIDWYYIVSGDTKYVGMVDIQYYKSFSDLWNRKLSLLPADTK